jgi:hypothetical protein
MRVTRGGVSMNASEKKALETRRSLYGWLAIAAGVLGAIVGVYLGRRLGATLALSAEGVEELSIIMMIAFACAAGAIPFGRHCNADYRLED